MQELIVVQKEKSKQIYLVEDGVLKEYYTESEENRNLEENIYIGKVLNVLPGMQAAFIDIGEDKKAFLHIKDLIPKKSAITGNKEENLERYKIKDYIKQNQPILVQVKKDSNTVKGPRVSSNIQIPGRFVVILPENNFITASQKIENEEEKNRLLKLVKEIKQNKNIGIIIRTAAVGKDKDLIEKDINQAIQKWEDIKKEFKNNSKEFPRILKRNETILEKILLDIADNKLNKITVNEEKLKEKIEQILINIQGKTDIDIEVQEKELENKYELNKQLEKAQNRKIWLKCGGFITIDKTEALTAIDVNSGKFTGKVNLEKTILKVNKEASEEIAKQIRLRDIGGIIIIDYIDMEEKNSKEEVLKTLTNKLKEDRAKTQIIEFTKLNLLEMTRKNMFTEK